MRSNANLFCCWHDWRRSGWEVLKATVIGLSLMRGGSFVTLSMLALSTIKPLN